MYDAATGRHPVHRSGLYGLDRADAVAMFDFTVEQISHGGQADVRDAEAGGALFVLTWPHDAA
ncbi:hypothetical protein D3C73_1579770 [compost metagenome]